jgi:hypothetical protein
MCTKWFNDGDVHAYFSPYESPYDAYIAFMNSLSDLQLRVSYATKAREKLEAKAKAIEPSIFTKLAEWFKRIFGHIKTAVF